MEMEVVDELTAKLRETNIKNVIIFSTRLNNYHNGFDLGPFQKTNKDGTLVARILSPAGLTSVTWALATLNSAWDKSDRGTLAAQGQDAVLPPRPNIELARFIGH